MDDDLIDTVDRITGGKYSKEQITAALERADCDPDDAIQFLLEEEKPAEMFSANVVRQSVDTVSGHDELRESRSNFAKILSKNKELVN